MGREGWKTTPWQRGIVFIQDLTGDQCAKKNQKHLERVFRIQGTLFAPAVV